MSAADEVAELLAHPLLTIADAARRVGVNHSDVEELIDEGGLPYFTLGDRGVMIRLREEDVDAAADVLREVHEAERVEQIADGLRELGWIVEPPR